MNESRREQATLMQVMAGILASFFGVRRRQKHEEGMAKATPGQVVVVGLVLTILFVLTIFFIVRLVLQLGAG